MEKVSEAIASEVQASFRGLAKTASQLNFVSDALGKYVAEIESGIKSLNLGVASWVTIHEWTSEDGLVTRYEQLGYEKIGKNWCIAVRSYRVAEWSEDYLDYEIWAFNDGPRHLRIDAIDKLPALLQRLDKAAANVAKSLAEKLPEACNAASEITAVVEAQRKLAPGKTR
jgi:hypothetical protein